MINLEQDKDKEIAQLKAELEKLRSQSISEATTSQRLPYEIQEATDKDPIQEELDTFEKYIIDNVFPNGIKVHNFIKTYLTIRGTDEVSTINDLITAFEKTVKPLMAPDGSIVLTGKLSELIRLAQPLLDKIGKVIGG